MSHSLWMFSTVDLDVQWPSVNEVGSPHDSCSSAKWVLDEGTRCVDCFMV